MTGDARGADQDPEPAVAAGPQTTFTHRQILAILSGLLLGMFLAALDQTVVSTAMRTIADDLNGYALQAWVTTAYLITATRVPGRPGTRCRRPVLAGPRDHRRHRPAP